MASTATLASNSYITEKRYLQPWDGNTNSTANQQTRTSEDIKEELVLLNDYPEKAENNVGEWVGLAVGAVIIFAVLYAMARKPNPKTINKNNRMVNNTVLGMRWHWWVTHVTALLGTFANLIGAVAVLIASSKGEYDGAVGSFLYDFGFRTTFFLLYIIIWCKNDDFDENLWWCCVSVFWLSAGARFVVFCVLAVYGAPVDDSLSSFIAYSILAIYNTIYYNKRKSIFFPSSQCNSVDAPPITEAPDRSMTKINETPADKETEILQKRELLIKAEANLQDLKSSVEEYKVILKKAFTKDQVREFVARGQFSEEEAKDYEDRRSALETHLVFAPSMIENTEHLIRDLKVEIYDLENS